MSAIMNGIAAHGGSIPYARHVPDVLRLRAQRAAHGRTDASAGDFRLHARLHRSRRGRPHASAHRAARGLAGDPAARRLAPVRRRGDGRLVGRRAAASATARAASYSRRQALEPQAAQPRADRRRSSAAATCSSTREGPPEVIVIATGSEVGIAAAGRQGRAGRGIRVRLVSMPSTTTFDRQDPAYRDERPAARRVSRRVAVEAGAREPWWRYVGLEGRIVGIDHFGASAPAKEVFKQFGFTAGARASGDRSRSET